MPTPRESADWGGLGPPTTTEDWGGLGAITKAEDWNEVYLSRSVIGFAQPWNMVLPEADTLTEITESQVLTSTYAWGTAPGIGGADTSREASSYAFRYRYGSVWKQ